MSCKDFIWKIESQIRCKRFKDYKNLKAVWLKEGRLIEPQHPPRNTSNNSINSRTLIGESGFIALIKSSLYKNNSLLRIAEKKIAEKKDALKHHMIHT